MGIRILELNQTRRYDLYVFKKIRELCLRKVKNTLSDKTKISILSTKYNLFVGFEFFFCSFITFFGKNLVLSYNSKQKIDGTGAQLQRILAIFALSQRYKMGFKNSQLNSVAIHPLDNIHSDQELTAYLAELNILFNLPEEKAYTQKNTDIYLINLRFRDLAIAALKSYSLRKQYTLYIVAPYGVSDYRPDNYKSVRKNLHRWNIEMESRKLSSKKKISVHYRSGVGGMAIQKGEKFPREIGIDYFIKIVDSIIQALDKEDDFEILIFTDAPTSDINYIPPSEQIKLWSTSPGFASGIMNVKGNDLSNSLRKYGDRCSIQIGGNPLTAIELMSKSNYLLMGRSSLSYVAAILNQNGVIYYPPNFWHPPMSTWKVSL